MLPGLGMPLSAISRAPISHVELQRMMDEAIAKHKTGKRDEAERLYITVLRRVPDHPDALQLLGVLNAERGKYDIAVNLISQALAKHPKDPIILNNLGNTLFKAHRNEEAVALFERAAALKPDFAEPWLNLGRSMRFVGRRDEAIAALRKYLEMKPNSGQAMAQISRILQDQGKFEEAERIARDIIAKFPGQPSGYASLANARKFRKGDPEIAVVEQLLEKAEKKRGEKRGLYFAAAKIYDDIGCYDDAFKYYTKANNLAEKQYNHDEVLKQRRALKAVFNKNYFAERANFGISSERPIFIVGMPRSGTTLCEQVLAAHPKITGAGELETIPQLARAAQEFAPGEAQFPEAIRLLTPFGAEIMARRYLRELDSKVGPEAPYVTDKMPHNFQNLGFIATILPKAKIIHCKRDPRDTSLSCWMQNFNDAHNYSRTLNDLGRYYREYLSLMEHWREVLPSPMFEVQYEEMVEDQEGMTRRMLEFLGLEWDDACLEFFKVERPVMTASSWQVRQPLYKSSKARWKNYEKHLGPLLAGLEGKVIEETPEPEESETVDGGEEE